MGLAIVAVPLADEGQQAAKVCRIGRDSLFSW